MRRMLAGAVAAVLILAGGQAALAKGLPGEGDAMSSAYPLIGKVPDHLKPGQPWNASIVFWSDGMPVEEGGFRPIVQLHDLNSGDILAFTGFQTSHPGWYTAHVVVPHEGRWSVSVRSEATGVARTYPVIDVGSTAVELAVSHSWPVWTWLVIGLLGALALGSAVILAPARRRQRVAA